MPTASFSTQKRAYALTRSLDFRRVLFRSLQNTDQRIRILLGRIEPRPEPNPLAAELHRWLDSGPTDLGPGAQAWLRKIGRASRRERGRRAAVGGERERTRLATSTGVRTSR